MKVELFHPELERVVEVDERQARVLRRSGWEDVAEVQEAEAQQETQRHGGWPFRRNYEEEN